MAMHTSVLMSQTVQKLTLFTFSTVGSINAYTIRTRVDTAILARKDMKVVYYKVAYLEISLSLNVCMKRVNTPMEGNACIILADVILPLPP